MTVNLEALDSVPDCSRCGGSRFRRASLFEQPTVTGSRVEVDHEPDCLDRARERLAEQGRSGQFLAFERDGETSILEMPERWTRIGRSGTADVRLDDPTVSRRHAVIVKTRQGGLRVLDDRSLNGVFVNGRRVEWSPLHEADELMIGRYRLYVIDTSVTPGTAASSPALNG